MKLWVILLVGFSALADVPAPVITFKNVFNSYATVAGQLSEPVSAPVGVSAVIGGLVYSGVTDPEGRWAFTMRHISNHFEVISWDLKDAGDRSAVKASLK